VVVAVSLGVLGGFGVVSYDLVVVVVSPFLGGGVPYDLVVVVVSTSGGGVGGTPVVVSSPGPVNVSGTQ
jgi:hypothetical protein